MTYFEGVQRPRSKRSNDGRFWSGFSQNGPNSLPRRKTLDEEQFQVD